MKRIVLVLVFLMMVSCSGEPLFKAQGVTEGIVMLSPTHKFDSIPSRVEANGNGNKVELSDIEVENLDSSLNITFKYKKQKQSFKPQVVFALVTADKYFVNYYDEKFRHVLFTPAGDNGNNVALSTSGYEVIESDELSGQLKVKIPKSMYGLYDIGGKEGKIFLFCLDADGGESQEADDLFSASSNVIESELKQKD